MTGNYRKPGSGAYPLRGHNNVQVIWEVCQINSQVIKSSDDEVRAKFEKNMV